MKEAISCYFKCLGSMNSETYNVMEFQLMHRMITGHRSLSADIRPKSADQLEIYRLQ